MARSLALIKSQQDELFVAAQNLIEFWAVATRPLINNGLGLTVTDATNKLIQLKALFAILSDSAEIFFRWEQLVIDHQVLGKQAHDARLVATMKVHNVTHLLTFNTADFKRYDGITPVTPSSL